MAGRKNNLFFIRETVFFILLIYSRKFTCLVQKATENPIFQLTSLNCSHGRRTPHLSLHQHIATKQFLTKKAQLFKAVPGRKEVLTAKVCISGRKYIPISSTQHSMAGTIIYVWQFCN